jgi:hypothetical protein
MVIVNLSSPLFVMVFEVNGIRFAPTATAIIVLAHSIIIHSLMMQINTKTSLKQKQDKKKYIFAAG